MKRRPEKFSGQPFIDYWVGWATGRVLTWLALRALKRSDWHEFNHIIAELAAGDSNHSNRPCVVPDHLLGRGDVVTVTFDGGVRGP